MLLSWKTSMTIVFAQFQSVFWRFGIFYDLTFLSLLNSTECMSFAETASLSDVRIYVRKRNVPRRVGWRGLGIDKESNALILLCLLTLLPWIVLSNV